MPAPRSTSAAPIPTAGIVVLLPVRGRPLRVTVTWATTTRVAPSGFLPVPRRLWTPSTSGQTSTENVPVTDVVTVVTVLPLSVTVTVVLGAKPSPLNVTQPPGV